MSRIIHLHNDYHLGDNVFNFILFYNIKKYIEQHNIIIYYYANSNYLYQLKEFISSKNVYLLDISHKPNHSLQLWINNKYFNNYIIYNKKSNISYNKFYINFFNIVLSKLNIQMKLIKLTYIDSELLCRYDKLNDIYKNIDILIVNSNACSGQYDYNENNWIYYINLLDQRYKIVTTKKIENILSTTDESLTIKDIAALSTNVKVIIAINTGVVPGLLNIYTLQKIKKFYTFDNNVYYNYPNFEHKKRLIDITFDELDMYITPLEF